MSPPEAASIRNLIPHQNDLFNLLCKTTGQGSGISEDFVPAHTSLIAELEDAVHGGSSHKRAAVLARITDLFVEGTRRFDDEQISAFDDVLGFLIDKIETKALAELSQRLAKLDRAPPRVIRRLAAHEEIAVAGPVLRHARQLDDDSLMDVAKASSQDHLLAISVRSRLNEPVTDVLVDRGNSAVVHSIAQNTGARFSENGMTALVRHAETDEHLASKIMERRDVPPQLFCRLLLQATEVVKERLLARARPETRQLIHQVLAKISGDIAAGMPAPPDYGTALRNLLRRHRSARHPVQGLRLRLGDVARHPAGAHRRRRDAAEALRRAPGFRPPVVRVSAAGAAGVAGTRSQHRQVRQRLTTPTWRRCNSRRAMDCRVSLPRR